MTLSEKHQQDIITSGREHLPDLQKKLICILKGKFEDWRRYEPWEDTKLDETEGKQ